MRKLNITILVGLLVALVGAGLVFAYGNNVDSRVADGKTTVKVLVAGSELALGASPADLTDQVVTKDVPAAYLAEGYLTALSDVTGQVLLGPVAKGAQLTRTAFGQPGSAGAVKPSKGNDALAVGVDLTPGVARYVTAGSSVDMFVTYAGGGARTKLFASGVRVLSVTIATPVDKQDRTSASSPVSQVVVVVDVDPRLAEKIVNATTIGRVYLGLSALGGKADAHTTPTGANPDDVVRSNR